MLRGWPPALEKTLHLVREDTEREIAAHRVRFYGFGLLVVLVAKLIPAAHAPWVPVFVLTLGFSVALGIERSVKRIGFSRAVVVLSTLFDLLLNASTFVIAHLTMKAQDPVQTAVYLCLLGIVFVFFLNISSLRLSFPVAVGNTVAAVVIYLATARFVLGAMSPPMVMSGALILFMIWFAYHLIGRTRRNLELSARYQELRRYLPAAAVDRVLHGDLESALSVGGQSLEVTLLASDLRGFTALSETLEPEEVVRQLNAYHARMLEQIDRFGGSLDKFIGDGTLVVFGLPTSADALPDQGAQAAVDCAGAMLEALAGLNAERAGAGLPPLHMGIGIHTGRVVAGNIGAPGRRLEFTVIGDAVNTAARLEGATKELGHPVVISRSTADRLVSADALVALPPIPLRGKQAAVPIFTLAERPAERPAERVAS